MTAPSALMSAEEMIDPLKAAVHCVRQHRGGIRGAEMEMAVAAVAAMAERHAATERDACLQAERANELASRLAAMAEREAALIVRLKALESEVSARRSGWASFVDDEDPSLLVVAHHDRSVHFTGASAWGDANAFDAARAEARDG